MRTSLLLLALFLTSVASAETNRSLILDMVLASVDGEPVTMSELRSYMSRQGQTPPTNMQSGNLVIRKALRELIVERLIEKEAESGGITVTEQEIDFYIAQIKQQNGLGDIQFDQALREQGLTMKRYREQVHSDLTRARVVSAKVRSTINIVDEDIQRFIKENPDRLPKQGAVSMEQFFVPLPESASVEEREKVIAEARELSGETEADAFKEKAGRGYTALGFLDPADLREELQTVAKSLSVGEVSPPVQTAEGVYVLRVASRQNESEKIDAELKQKIKSELLEARTNSALEKFLNNELPKKYHVEIKL